MDVITKRFLVYLKAYINTEEKQKEYLLRLNDPNGKYAVYLKSLFGGRSVTVREIIVSIEHFQLEPIFLFSDDSIDRIYEESVVIGRKMRDIIIEKNHSKELIISQLKITERQLDDYIDGKGVIPAYKLKKFAQITQTSLAEFNSSENYQSKREINLYRTIEDYKAE